MRISKEKAAENRAALVRAASKLIRERGIDGVGVAEISKEAGLTHGALYAHFRSKEELALEALSHGLDQAAARMYAATVDGMPDLATFLDRYLSLASRDDYADRCAMAASASEIGRQDQAISARFAEGYMVMVRAFERQIAMNGAALPAGAGGAAPAGDALGRAMVVVATMIGSLAVARGAAKGNPAVSEQLLEASRRMLDEMMLAGAR